MDYICLGCSLRLVFIFIQMRAHNISEIAVDRFFFLSILHEHSKYVWKSVPQLNGIAYFVCLHTNWCKKNSSDQRDLLYYTLEGDWMFNGNSSRKASEFTGSVDVYVEMAIYLWKILRNRYIYKSKHKIQRAQATSIMCRYEKRAANSN